MHEPAAISDAYYCQPVAVEIEIRQRGSRDIADIGENDMKNFIFVGAILLGLGVLAVPGTASAHAPSIVGETQCRASADADWTVDWTVLPDERFADLTWSVVTGSGYSPSGSQSAGSTFTKTSTYTSADATGREANPLLGEPIDAHRQIVDPQPDMVERGHVDLR